MKYLRIKKNDQFNKLFRRGQRAFSDAVTFVYMPSKKLCMGVAVSKKHGKAVRRNRIKRLLRQAFYNVCDNLEAPYSIILIPKAAESYSLEEFEKSMLKCIKKVNSCKGK